MAAELTAAHPASPPPPGKVREQDRDVALRKQALFERLLADGLLPFSRDSLPSRRLPSRPVAWDRVEGMMLGIAIGDALANTTETLSPRERRARHGTIRDYLPNPFAGGRKVGLPTTDTQYAFWMLEQIVRDRGFVPENVAARLARERVFGRAETASEFREAHAAGKPWYLCGAASAGNGAIVRIPGILVPHVLVSDDGDGLWIDTVLAALVTHRDEAAIAACVACVAILAELLSTDAPPEREWWFDAYVDVAARLEGDRRYWVSDASRRRWAKTSELVADVRKHVESTAPLSETLLALRTGAYLLETVPAVLLIAAGCSRDPEEALVRAVNDTYDNDSIAAVVGAFVGALHGASAFAERWRTALLGRTRDADDGFVFRVLDEARRVFA